MTSMPNPRAFHSCGLVANSEQGPEIVVAGGYDDGFYLDTVDIYVLDTNSWREGNLRLTP